MNTAVATYAVYLLISVGLTIWVARTLYKNGSLFLVDVFRGNKDLANAVNHLLVVGFYLVNLGYVSLSLRISAPPSNPQEAIEKLSMKIGGVLLVLGILHLSNVFVFNRIRSRATESHNPPVQPNAFRAPQTGPAAQWQHPDLPPA